jgi:hypothetical protein
MHQDIHLSDDGHDAAAGSLCQDDGTGCCGICGVAMSVCNECGGIGYHRDLCAESDETIALESVRADLDVRLLSDGLFDQWDALKRCDPELLRVLRTLGVAGREQLSALELVRVRAMMRPTLVRVAAARREFGP